jgi:hypothetical protein
MSSLSNKKVIVSDTGMHTFVAEKLAETFAEVYYHIPESSSFPQSTKAKIGSGLNITRIYDLWKYIDKADIIMFTDLNDGELQHWLRGKGYNVFGAGRGEDIEIDRVKFLETLKDVGLPVPKTYRAEGFDDLTKYLDGKGEKYLKTSYFRGDFESYKFKGMKHLEPWLDDLRSRIGNRAKDIEILVQDPVPSESEVGYDGFSVNGQFTSNCLVGYEVKDKAYIGKVFREPPPILKTVNDKMGPVFKKLGFQGHFSSEVRITKTGKGYFIDPVCGRLPSPPGELMTELFSNYAEIVWKIAHNEVPVPKAMAPYGAQIVLVSSWHQNHELCVEFPKELSKHIKLKNHGKWSGSHYCTPNEGDGYFGGVIGWGSTPKQAMDKCESVIDEIVAEELNNDPAVFDTATAAIQAGRKFGVNL